MRPDEREALRARFAFRCGYCGVSETDAGTLLTVDHFQPRSRGGVDASENWVYCCHACNEFKADHWQPDSIHRILHPLHDRLVEHVGARDDGTLVVITETGAFHIERLHLNRASLVAHRRERRLLATARQLQSDLLRRLQRLEEEVQDLAGRVERLSTGEAPSQE